MTRREQILSWLLLVAIVELEFGYSADDNAQKYKFETIKVRSIEAIRILKDPLKSFRRSNEKSAEENKDKSSTEEQKEAPPNHLHAMAPEDQLRFCLVVSNNVVDTAVMDMEGFVLKEYYRISYINGKREFAHGLTCPTTPRVTVYLGKSDLDIKIALVDPFLSRFTFRWHVVESISPIPNFPDDDIHNDRIFLLSSEEQRQLCLAAQAHTSAEGMKQDEAMVQMAGYKIGYSWTREGPETVAALPCPNTSPALYLHARDWEFGKLMIFSENEFIDKQYEFSPEIMESVHQLEAQDIHSKKILEEHYFSKINAARRWHLCITANKKTRPELSALWSTRKTFENVGIYEFAIRNGVKWLKNEKHVAFPCSTSRGDALYLRLGNSPKKFMVMVYDKPFERLKPISLDEFQEA